MKALTDKQQKILSIIKTRGGWVSPTAIGLQLGYCYEQASSKCNGTIKTLVKAGFIERGTKSPNKGKYRYIRVKL